MFIIFGTKSTKKILGVQKRVRCGRCNNIAPWQVLKITNWFSLFFLPIIPISTKYFEICPICHGANQITYEEAIQSIVSESAE